jgi:SecD/SecF fusion protein
MQQNYTGRVGLVLLVLFGCLAMIFSPVLEKLFHPKEEITQWINLKPGIDMVGGTSLVYQIKKPPGNTRTDLATQVVKVLKKRVDPRGLMNLVWRPEGSDRIEIQMPSSGESGGEARAAREQLITAEQGLEQTNISLSEVTDAVEQKNGHTRAEFTKLADGSKTRLDLLKQLAGVYDQIEAIHKKPVRERNPLEEAGLLSKYKQLTHKIEETNVDVNRVRDDLNEASSADATSPEAKKAEQQRKAAAIAELKKQNAEFPSRLAAIDQYAKAFDAYEKDSGRLDDTTDLKRKLRGAGVLEFHILAAQGEVPQDQLTKMYDRLKPGGAGPAIQSGDTLRWFEFDKKSEAKLGGRNITASYRNKEYVLAWITPEKSLDHREGQKPWALTSASEGQGSNGESLVNFAFDAQGASDFGNLTQANLQKPLAIILDGKLISAPNINSMISGSGQIDGGSDGFSRTELDYLVNTLTAGSSPAQLESEPISERHVESELGHANLVHGLFACAVGVVVVGVFLVSYYYLAGVVAFFAVVMNLLIVLGVMAGLQATFTLPSIAGIVLSVGTAVDANVLIFERLREEQHRGLSLRMALRNAYDKAFSAILDSNMTTFITSLCLIWFGTEEVKGFGITLVIGILASLFTALFVTRTIFGLLIDKLGVRQLNSLPLTFPKWDKLLKPNIDWMSFAWVFYTFSAVAITIGLVLFSIKVRQGQMFDIEFAGGTSVQFDLNTPMSKSGLSDRLQHSGQKVLAAANPVALGAATNGKYTSFDLLTPSTDAVAVRDAVTATLGKDLKLELQSTFDGAGPGGVASDMSQALNQEVLPVTEKTNWPIGVDGRQFRPDNWPDYRQGVAIVLNHLNPKLTPGQISDRINREFLAGTGNQGATRRPFSVESPRGASEPTSLAIVLSTDPNLPYEKDPKQWSQLFAGPLWKTVVAGVDRPAQLKEVRNFDAQVAGDAQTHAVLALSFSILAIMAYIWFRFGNLKYGTATMVALLHDTIFTIAALGFAHYLVDVPAFKQIFQLEPFRINLTVVAGILTIMGYSMIDTIVVFDRIRENRGKYGHVSRQVINDAVNQTLSRTLLTCGTTTITVAIMYFLGGEGIHGFTFVLLIGILVGTYSSVAIAAPILLLGNKDAQPAAAAPAAQPGRKQLQKAGSAV